jgi:type I restriction enzyme, S subunit
MNWELVKLGDVCDVLGGYAFKSENFKNEGTPLLRISNIYDGEISFKEDCVCVESSNLESLQKFKVKKGDILLALSGATTGKFGVYNLASDSFLNQRVGLIRATEKLNQKYLLFYFNIFKAQIEQIAQGAAQPNISTNEICNLQIPLPPLPTQKRIAEILDSADALCRKDQALLKKYDELAQAIFIDMFGDPVKNEKGWEVSSIRNIAKKISDGPFGSNLKTEHYSKVGVRVIRLKNIEPNNFNNSDSAFVKFDHYENVLKKYTCYPGDILIGTLGEPNLRACIFPKELEKAVNKADCVNLRINTAVVNENYISFYLNISNKLHGQTRTRISMGQVAQLLISIPPKKLQNKFSDKIETLNDLQKRAQRTYQNSETLFNSLIQKAFNGELMD